MIHFSPMSAARFDITFTGRVQGVGFRATAQHISRNHDVTGWVRNEPDGNVRCVAEGEEDELNRFVEAIQHAMSGLITETKISRGAATGEFSSFGVKH